jgi:hypothetical protein
MGGISEGGIACPGRGAMKDETDGFVERGGVG